MFSAERGKKETGGKAFRSLSQKPRGAVQFHCRSATKILYGAQRRNKTTDTYSKEQPTISRTGVNKVTAEKNDVRFGREKRRLGRWDRKHDVANAIM